MKIALGCDHAGFVLKKEVKEHIEKLGYEVIDVGTNSEESVDYPDFAFACAEKVAKGEAEKGVIICGSGVGACITANKVKGVRAAICHDEYSATQGVEHDDMNVICIGGRIVNNTTAKILVENFLKAKFTKEERHLRRLNKVLDIEKNNFK
ncbi:MAG: ribose 5-phosphate isomerase B [Elusimicrobiaceae bacterium]|jgi:ribose 5-phosphate isomerase B|nr:ribose 5-phosphate isomerase B [Elusimicrobiaceae bacterium]MBT3954728.1 ribose 5-phosphate isomerase B [Elusimicrobiaceae bacterium]MBT4008320.1 ribose 5-phosphate isomerase B [Elusimicrobiaceae bacterium]MBT4402454.1 ribose 5-phosphate isomerase B [Elusimicrobiaceae bacterium]MBT4439386.1 ribose 5-phosphate isomerase B [Elusimicrobiaceae bacterium]